MNLDLKTIVTKLAPAIGFMQKYGAFAVLISILGLYTFLVFDISRMSSAEPSEDAVEERLKTVQIPKLDETTLKKIKDLQDQNVQVKSLFDQARQNPFSE